MQWSMVYSAPTNACCINGVGGMYIAGSLTQNSDQIIKTNIKTIENALWKVQQLRGVEYTHIIEGTRNIGLIAQEVEFIIPEVVSIGERNNIKGINYQNLVALLINAIKEQQDEINFIKNILKKNNLI